MVALHVIQQPLSIGHPVEKAPTLTVTIDSPIGMETIQLVDMVLGIREELGTLPEALGMGQVCRRQAASVPQAVR